MDLRAVTVAKFGGSSLATEEKIEHVADRLAALRATGRGVVAVVSARGDTTDRLVATASALGHQPDNGTDRESDQLLATGELASAAQVALALRSRGVEAESLSGGQAGIRATGPHGCGLVTAVDTTRIEEALAAGRLPVVAGFQAHNDDGDVVTLGRGGSDTSAVALAAALGASSCEIYTDVPGVLDADPRVVEGADVIGALSLPLMAEMAFAGARVLHVRAVELAAACGMELMVRPAHSPDGGSVVVPRRPWALEEGAGPLAVTHEEDLAQITLRGLPDPLAVLEALAERDVTVDAMTWAPGPEGAQLVLCVASSGLSEVGHVLDTHLALTPDRISVRDGFGKVSVVGTGLLTRPRIAASALAALRAAGIAAQCVSASQTRLCFTVPAERLTDAVRIAHRQVVRSRPHPDPTGAGLVPA